MKGTSAQKKNAIFMTFDSNYLDYAVACLSSITVNFPNYPDVFVRYAENDTEGLKRILSFPRTQRLIFEDEDGLMKGLDLGPIASKEAFMRFFVWSSIFDDYDKVLYLDVDCLVLSSLDHLFEKDDFYIVRDLLFDPSAQYWVFKPGNECNLELENLLKEDGLTYENVQHKMYNSGMFMIPKQYRTAQNWKKLWNIARRYNDFLMLGDQSVISIWCALHAIVGKKDFENNFQIAGLLYFSMELSVENLKQYLIEKDRLKIVHFNALKPHVDKIDKFKINYEVYKESYQRYQFYLNMVSPNSVRKERLSISDISLVWVINSDEEEELLTERRYLMLYLEKMYSEYEILVVEYGKQSVFRDRLGGRMKVNYHYIDSKKEFSEVQLVNLGINLAANRKVLVYKGIHVAHPKSILKASKLIDEEYTFIIPHNDNLFRIDLESFKRKRANLDFFPETNHQTIDWSKYALQNPANDNERIDGFCFMVERIGFNLSGMFKIKFMKIVEAYMELNIQFGQQSMKVAQLPFALYSFANDTHELKITELAAAKVKSSN